MAVYFGLKIRQIYEDQRSSHRYKNSIEPISHRVYYVFIALSFYKKLSLSLVGELPIVRDTIRNISMKSGLAASPSGVRFFLATNIYIYIYIYI